MCRQWTNDGVCKGCTALFRGAQMRCRRCALPLQGAELCGECVRDPPAFERTTVAFDYAFPWDRLILDLKFQARTELAAALASFLANELRLRPADTDVDLLVPVPLSAARLAERGYNQSILIAQALSRQLGVACDAHSLQRPLETAHQADLPRAERARNLRGAFMWDPRQREHLQQRRVALVDDVMTTGATAREAAAELRRAGAAAVEVWALARTP